MSRGNDPPSSKHAGPSGATTPPPRLESERDLRHAVDLLRAADPNTIGSLLAAVGYPALRQRPRGFDGLAAIIVGQQVSTASAEAMFGRLGAALDPLTAATLLHASDELLRGCGLSRGKIRTLRVAATAVEEGRLSFDRLATLPAEAAHAELVAVPGIGPWTADIFLLFGLGHADAWPSGDLALQEAVRALMGLEARPGARELLRRAEPWRPYRGVAAHLLWAYYRLLRTPALDRHREPAAKAATGSGGERDG